MTRKLWVIILTSIFTDNRKKKKIIHDSNITEWYIFRISTYCLKYLIKIKTGSKELKKKKENTFFFPVQLNHFWTNYYPIFQCKQFYFSGSSSTIFVDVFCFLLCCRVQYCEHYISYCKISAQTLFKPYLPVMLMCSQTPFSSIVIIWWKKQKKNC
jgi:hypothetical protein